MNHSRHGIRAALAGITALALLATACGGGQDSNPSGPADLAKLDAGNYPISPRDLEKERTAETGAIQEAIKLGSFVPLITDLDSRLVHGRITAAGKITPQHPPTTWVTPSEKFTEFVPGLVAGWRTAGSRRENPNLGLNVELALLRFTSAELAVNAARVLAEETHKTNPPKHPLEIAGYPGHTFLSYNDAVETWLPRGDYVVKLFIRNVLATPPDPAPLLDFAKRALDKQFELLQGYAPTAADKLSENPIDPEGLLARTLPSPDLGTDEDHTGVYPVAAELHLRSRPDMMKRAYDDAKVDLIATAGSQIYRTGDPAAAERLLAALTEGLTASFYPYDSPPGLPDAKCYKAKSGSTFGCYLTYEHLLAEVVASQPQDLNQKMAAQYKLLTHGR
ncbi:hypothetical protein [Nocardia sp. XZ_19_385]|uniref:DUF7373 family lipoprotein n=1 Tax=Nocardia sp. XZ_19_385 TaxID=2769488 RepID=UPI00188DCD90|nr:hypothetical protein [Nocardia sp. XZ_19_385]